MNKLVCLVVVAAAVSLVASCGPAATPVPTQLVIPSTPTLEAVEVTQGPPTVALSTTTPKRTATSTPEERTPFDQVELETVTLKVSGFT